MADDLPFQDMRALQTAAEQGLSLDQVLADFASPTVVFDPASHRTVVVIDSGDADKGISPRTPVHVEITGRDRQHRVLKVLKELSYKEGESRVCLVQDRGSGEQHVYKEYGLSFQRLATNQMAFLTVAARHGEVIDLDASQRTEHAYKFLFPYFDPAKGFVILQKELEERAKRKEPFTEVETAEILAGVAKGLQVVTHVGYIYRDVKPGNIALDPKRKPKLLDFDIIWKLPIQPRPYFDEMAASIPFAPLEGLISAEDLKTEGGRKLFGKAAQVSEINDRYDVYSLGVVGYALRKLRLPFRLSAEEQITTKRLEQKSVNLAHNAKRLAMIPKVYAGLVDYQGLAPREVELYRKMITRSKFRSSLNEVLTYLQREYNL